MSRDRAKLTLKLTSRLVLQNIGPVGSPGMPEAGYIPIPKKLAQAGVKDMLRISDGRMSGTASGAVVLHVVPEASIGGPLAVVQDGDRIRLDVETRQLDLLISAEEMATRLDRWRASTATAELEAKKKVRGYKGLYRRSVLQADKGADFDFLTSEGC